MDELGNALSPLSEPEHSSDKANVENISLSQVTIKNLKNNNDIISIDNVLQRNNDIQANFIKDSNVPLSDATKNISNKNSNTNNKKEVVTKETAFKIIKIIRILNNVEIEACKNIHEAKKVKNIESDAKVTLNSLERLFKNTNLTITKVNSQTHSQISNLNTYENKIENGIELSHNVVDYRQSEAIFPDLEKVLEATNAIINNKNITTLAENPNENRHSYLINTQNLNDHLEIHVNDETSNCLKEFDKVLAEVKENDDFVEVEALSLEGINDIILDEELNIDDDIFNIDDFFNEDLDMDSTYNFQEIKHATSGVDSKNAIDTDVISISSDDTSIIVENNSTNTETTLNSGNIKEGEFLQGNNTEPKSFVENKRFEETHSTSSIIDTKCIQKTIEEDENSETKNVYTALIILDDESKKNNSVVETRIFEESESIEETSENITNNSDHTTRTKTFKIESNELDIKYKQTTITKIKCFEEAKSTNSVVLLAKSPKNTKREEIQQSEETRNNETDSLEEAINTESTEEVTIKEETLEEAKSPYKAKHFKVAKNLEGARSLDESNTFNAIIDTISISSDQHIETISSKSESCDCGYQSSDFEFISEDEAKKEGPIIDFNFKMHLDSTKHTAKVNKTPNKFQSDPFGPGPSSKSGRYSYYSGENEVIIDESYKENYVVPTESQMVNMFHELPGMPSSSVHFLENKSVYSRAPVMVQYEGIGFDLTLAMQPESEDDEYRDEANDSMKKIFEMYSDENH